MSDIEFDRNLVITLGRSGRDSYPDRSWEEIEPVLRTTWEFDRRLGAWTDVRAAVHAAWRACDVDVAPARLRAGRHGVGARAA
ncbi:MULTISPECIES: hypothetical protein [Luteimonas]|jgi:hypothetical protein|uniref:hypothetical protein n=1 Tax=Luteimonas TaxID=83614 RepID=UPI000C7972E7|nr:MULTISPECIES: hypothetical protein [Luteimonas]